MNGKIGHDGALFPVGTESKHDFIGNFPSTFDRTEISRLCVAFNYHVDVADGIDDIAWVEHRCIDSECCTPPLASYTADAMETLHRPGWVYALTQIDGRVVYVGMTTGRLPRRIAEHLRSPASTPWNIARRLKLRPDVVVAWNVGDSAARLEKAAILLLQPPMNTADLT